MPDVQKTLETPTTLNMWLALALLNDPERAGDVTGFLRSSIRGQSRPSGSATAERTAGNWLATR